MPYYDEDIYAMDSDGSRHTNLTIDPNDAHSFQTSVIFQARHGESLSWTPSQRNSRSLPSNALARLARHKTYKLSIVGAKDRAGNRLAD